MKPLGCGLAVLKCSRTSGTGLMDLLHVDQQRLPVVLPLPQKLAGVRELVAGELHRHLEAVGVQVAEVVHTCRERNAERFSTVAGGGARLKGRLIGTHFLTSWYVVPVGSVDDVVVSEEVLVVARPSVRVGHHLG